MQLPMITTPTSALALVLTAALALPAAAARIEVETLAGETVTGELVEWSDEAVVLTTDEGMQSIARTKLLAIRPEASDQAAAKQPAVWIELADGSRLEAEQFTAAGGECSVKLTSGAELQLPTRSIAAVRFKEQNEALARQWEQIVGLNLPGDVIVIRKSDAIDYLEGVLGDVSNEKVDFELDGDSIPVARDKVEGLIYYTGARPELPTAACIVQGQGTTRIHAKTIALKEDQVELVSLQGLELTLPLEKLQELDFSLGKIQYLSEMQPVASNWTPYFDLFAQLPTAATLFEPRMNEAFEGGPLLLGGKAYRRGIALRSGTELKYRLPDGFQRLTAIAGIDDRVGEGGAVQLRIVGDNRELLSTAIRGGESPRPIDLDIAGVRQLTIVVDYGPDLDIADHLDLCEARISK